MHTVIKSWLSSNYAEHRNHAQFGKYKNRSNSHHLFAASALWGFVLRTIGLWRKARVWPKWFLWRHSCRDRMMRLSLRRFNSATLACAAATVQKLVKTFTCYSLCIKLFFIKPILYYPYIAESCPQRDVHLYCLFHKNVCKCICFCGRIKTASIWASENVFLRVAFLAVNSVVVAKIYSKACVFKITNDKLPLFTFTKIPPAFAPFLKELT